MLQNVIFIGSILIAAIALASVARYVISASLVYDYRENSFSVYLFGVVELYRVEKAEIKSLRITNQPPPLARSLVKDFSKPMLFIQKVGAGDRDVVVSWEGIPIAGREPV